jgi:hypothetical protein
MRILIITLLISSLVNCAVSSGVTKTGLNTFTISTSASPGRGGVPAAKRAAYEEAAAECNNLGNLQLFTLNETAAPPTWTEGMANFTLNFKCLKPNEIEKHN